jgi:hypothetical protein
LTQNQQENKSDSASLITLETVRVVNQSSEPTDFDTTVVLNGDNRFQSELAVPADELARPTVAWDDPVESFVVFGDATRYDNYEVVAANHEQNRTDTPLAVEFVIDEQGDVESNLDTVDSV